jgi:hypothetical protein
VTEKQDMLLVTLKMLDVSIFFIFNSVLIENVIFLTYFQIHFIRLYVITVHKMYNESSCFISIYLLIFEDVLFELSFLNG